MGKPCRTGISAGSQRHSAGAARVHRASRQERPCNTRNRLTDRADQRAGTPACPLLVPVDESESVRDRGSLGAVAALSVLETPRTVRHGAQKSNSGSAHRCEAPQSADAVPCRRPCRVGEDPPRSRQPWKSRPQVAHHGRRNSGLLPSDHLRRARSGLSAVADHSRASDACPVFSPLTLGLRLALASQASPWATGCS